MSSVEGVLVEHGRIFRQLDVASMIIFVYDYFLTLGSEIDLIWSSPWNAVKFLFFIARYMPFIDLINHFTHDISIKSCTSSYDATGWLFLLGVSITEAIQTFRTWAVWKTDQRIQALLIIAYIGALIASTILLAKFLGTLQFPAPSLLSPALEGCTVINGSSILSIVWMILLGLDSVNLFFMVIKGIQCVRSGSTFSGLMQTVYQDGISYYIFLVGLNLLNIVLVLKLPRDFVVLLATMERAVHAILACRMVMHIRQQLHRRHKPDEWLMSDMTGGDSSQDSVNRRQTYIAPYQGGHLAVI